MTSLQIFYLIMSPSSYYQSFTIFSYYQLTALGMSQDSYFDPLIFSWARAEWNHYCNHLLTFLCDKLWVSGSHHHQTSLQSCPVLSEPQILNSPVEGWNAHSPYFHLYIARIFHFRDLSLWSTCPCHTSSLVLWLS